MGSNYLGYQQTDIKSPPLDHRIANLFTTLLLIATFLIVRYVAGAKCAYQFSTIYSGLCMAIVLYNIIYLALTSNITYAGMVNNFDIQLTAHQLNKVLLASIILCIVGSLLGANCQVGRSLSVVTIVLVSLFSLWIKDISILVDKFLKVFAPPFLANLYYRFVGLFKDFLLAMFVIKHFSSANIRDLLKKLFGK